MAAKKKKRKPPGPEAETIKVPGPWERAVRKALKKGKPPKELEKPSKP
jgi:hypothetical protein